ncbi:MAG: hypothetical protein M1830_003479 [Pleopsidium flavum]|nr:MAG: hypothetical protein M1830_003479 [Pleopsidium flavum]
MDLSLDLRVQAKRRKKWSRGSEAGELCQTTNLASCLRTFTSCEKLQANAYTCTSQICGGLPQKASKELGIKKLPPVLCMQLKKYEFTNASRGKLDAKLQFPLQLDMFPYTTRGKKHARKSEDAGVSPQVWYDLSSVIVHKGKLDSGHYICYCRKGENWFLFDDSKVMLAKGAEVLDADAYLLFYLVRSLDGPTEQKLPPAGSSA